MRWRTSYFRPHPRTTFIIATNRVACAVRLSVGLSVTVVSPAKTSEPIEMPFGLSTRLGPRNHVLDGVQWFSWWRGPAVEHWSLADVLSLSCARLVADG